MSVFSTPVAHVTTDELRELLTERAAENVRLEFKRDIPDKDEMLKKLSSFANTYGGLLIIGASAQSKDGRITDLTGVDAHPNLKQTIVQWCVAGINPPLTPEVSDPIPAPAGDKYCYVVSIPESEHAPHFLNGRNGIYVRTDEYSSHFRPQLANERELHHLLDRRRIVRERRAILISRARERFRTYTQQLTAEQLRGAKPLPTFLQLSITPQYPAEPLTQQGTLLDVIKQTRVTWRQTGFPRHTHDIITQHESVLALAPAGPSSLLEATTWGTLSYATSIAEEREQYRGIHAPGLLGTIMVFFAHARTILGTLGATGNLHIEIALDGIRGIPWIHFSDGFPNHGNTSPLDDAINLPLTTTTDTLTRNTDHVTTAVFQLIFFAMNWPDVTATPERQAALLRAGSDYNLWTQRDTR